MIRGLRLTAAIMLCAVILPAPGRAAAPPADSVWAALREVPWGVSFADWHKRRPSVACEEFRTLITATRADDEWCYRCAQQNGPVSLEWAFYAFGPAVPPACGLQQFRAGVTGSEESRQEAYQRLLARLSAEYGAGTSPGPLYERGSADWIDTLRWRSAALDLYLYTSRGALEPARTGLLVRDRALVNAIVQDEARMYRDWDWLAVVPGRWDQPLAAALRGQFPELPALFAKVRALDYAGGEWPRDLDDIRDGLRGLLAAAATATGERQAALLLAAERLAQAWHGVPEFAGWDRERAELSGMGLGFTYSELGAAWIYSHDLLWRVWREHGETEWGAHAFVYLLHHGWDTGVGCGNGADMFREVIRQGEAFLAKRSTSPRRLDVLFALGQAYETWWALSRSSEDVYANPADYQAGADAAREKAIRFYEEVVTRAPGSPEAAFARRELPRLKLKIATAQFRFFCVYD